jgi:hypothetical protein
MDLDGTSLEEALAKYQSSCAIPIVSYKSLETIGRSLLSAYPPIESKPDDMYTIMYTSVRFDL